MSANCLNIMSMNVWGVPFVTDKNRRLRALSTALSHRNFDIIGFQEVWQRRDVYLLTTGGQVAGLNYHHYYPSSGSGSGLLILSRYPIIEASFHRFRVDGSHTYTWMLHHYLASKGIGFARIATPYGDIDLYNTHFVMQVENQDIDVHASHRAAQAYELARCITRHDTGNPVIALGDFNTQPHHQGYTLMQTLSDLRDAYLECNAHAPPTYSKDNPYNQRSQDQRLDYIFVRDGVNHHIKTNAAYLDFDYLPDSNRRMAYSDHYGIVVEINIAPTPNDHVHQPDAQTQQATLIDLQQTISHAVHTAERNQGRAIRALQMGMLALLPGAVMLPLPRKRLWVALLVLHNIIQGWFAAAFLRDECHSLQGIVDEIALLRQAKEPTKDEKAQML